MVSTDRQVHPLTDSFLIVWWSQLQRGLTQWLDMNQKRSRKNKSAPLTPEQQRARLLQLEHSIGQAVPSDYAEFLLTQAARTPGNQYACDVPAPDHTHKTLYNFVIAAYFVLDPNSPNDLIENLPHYRAWMPSGFLPIAFDRFRNVMALSLNDGQVYFLNAPNEHSEWGNRPYVVAEDFRAFSRKLYRNRRFS